VKKENTMKSKEKLLELIRRDALSFGNFKMASGKTSNVMLDLSKAFRSEEAQRLIGECTKDVLPEVIVIGGPISGSDLVCSAIARSGITHNWFGVRKEPKGRGYDVGLITGNLEKGERVWLVEDVCTSGGTILRASKGVLEFGAKIEGIFAVVNRGGLEVAAEELQVPYKFIFDLNDITEGQDNEKSIL
jgi:orotate phosphoribosyltransferase